MRAEEERKERELIEQQMKTQREKNIISRFQIEFSSIHVDEIKDILISNDWNVEVYYEIQCFSL